MLTLSEISKRFDVQIKKLRRMDRAGVLNCEAELLPEESTAQKMIRYFGSRREFTAAHLVSLIDEPGLVDCLGRHADKAYKQLARLGTPVEPASVTVSAEIWGAAVGEEYSVARIVEWCKTVIPVDRTVTHHYLAVRLLLGVPKTIRHFDERRLSRVMLNCRKQEGFAGWWHVEEIKGRTVTVYHHPERPFDL